MPAKMLVQKYLLGENIHMYGSFFTTEGFNLHSLHSPFQMEVHKERKDSSLFSTKVIYPYAKNFEMVTPLGEPEKYVASKLKKDLDAHKKTKGDVNFWADYDGMSEAVRNYQKPQTKGTVVKNHLHAIGTASPEASKYGFEESIQIGVIEVENHSLAGDRLLKTLSKLEKFGVTVDSYEAKELQFSSQEEVNNALLHPEVLEDMRYVQLSSNTQLNYTDVETEKYPVLLPIWILLLLWLIQRIKRTKKVSIQNTEVWEVLIYASGILAVIVLLILVPFFYKILLAIIIITLIVLFINLIIKLINNTKFKKIKKPQWLLDKIRTFIESIVYYVLLFVSMLIQLGSFLIKKIRGIPKKMRRCREQTPTCAKIIMAIMSVIIVIETLIIIF